MSAAKVTAKAHERMVVPPGCELSALSMLARASEAVELALRISPDSATGPDPRAWLARVDAVLRDKDRSGECIDLARQIATLLGTAEWDNFLSAVTMDARHASEIRFRNKTVRSLWGTTPIINLIQGVKADRMLGVDAESLVLTSYYITTNFTINLSDHIAVTRDAGIDVETALYWLVFIWAMVSYDIFYFFYDRGILPAAENTGVFTMGINRRELALLNQSNKLVYTFPYGADYRTREPTMSRSRFNFCMDCPTIGGFCFCNSQAWDIVFHTIGAYVTATLSSGLATAQLPGSRRLEHVVAEPELIEPRYPRPSPTGKLRLLHVPNHPHFKGTRYLDAALKRFGPDSPIELVSETGISNERVHQLMDEADVVLDQLIGGYFGLTALEAMAHGKPVICYIVDKDIVLAPDECPIINASPDTIYDVLKHISDNRSSLESIGRKSRTYVEKYYSVNALSGRLQTLYAETAGFNVPLGVGNGLS